MNTQEVTFSLSNLVRSADASHSLEYSVQMQEVIDVLGLRSHPEKRVTVDELMAAAEDLPVIALVRDLVCGTANGTILNNTAFIAQGGGLRLAA